MNFFFRNLTVQMSRGPGLGLRPLTVTPNYTYEELDDDLTPAEKFGEQCKEQDEFDQDDSFKETNEAGTDGSFEDFEDENIFRKTKPTKPTKPTFRTPFNTRTGEEPIPSTSGTSRTSGGHDGSPAQLTSPRRSRSPRSRSPRSRSPTPTWGGNNSSPPKLRKSPRLQNKLSQMIAAEGDSRKQRKMTAKQEQESGEWFLIIDGLIKFMKAQRQPADGIPLRKVLDTLISEEGCFADRIWNSTKDKAARAKPKVYFVCISSARIYLLTSLSPKSKSES